MVKFVYFDVGGVVIKDISDEASWNKYKEDIGLAKERYDDFDIFWDEVDPQLNTIQKVDTLIPILTEKFDLKFPKGFSLQADFVRRFQKNESIWPIIDRVQQKLPTGLLTNMYPGMLESIQQAGLLPKVSWDTIIDSSIVGAQKPDLKIFTIAQQQARTKGNEILFIDNSARNITGAQVAGWNTFLYDQTNLETTNSELNKLLDSLTD